MECECDTLIVGLGPVGDVIAGLVRLEGLSVVAIDREAAPYPQPRAAVFDDEVMRIFQKLGVAERIEPTCRTPDRYEFVSASKKILLDFPVRGVPTVSGWEGSYVLHQPAVEKILRARLEEIGVDVRLGHRFLGLTQDRSGVTAAVANDDRAYQIRARYVIGTDGAGSAVRDAISASLFDYAFDEPWLVVDATAPDSADLPSRLMQVCDPRRPATYLKMTADRYRWEFMILPGETSEQVLDESFIRGLLAEWTSDPALAIQRKAVYRFHGLVAEQWRDRRVLLAGDAAHQMPPFAGQGMCSGIRDAGNLAWKLGTVVRREADDALLDSYQQEREPHVRAIIETAIAMGRIVCLRDPAAAAERDVEMLARRASGLQELSMRYPDLSGGCFDTAPEAGALFPQFVAGGHRMDDALGEGFWLLCDTLPPDIALPAGVKAFELDALQLAPFAASVANWLDERRSRAVVVRPDRHIFGLGEPRALIARLITTAGMNRIG